MINNLMIDFVNLAMLYVVSCTTPKQVLRINGVITPINIVGPRIRTGVYPIGSGPSKSGYRTLLLATGVTNPSDYCIHPLSLMGQIWSLKTINISLFLSLSLSQQKVSLNNTHTEE